MQMSTHTRTPSSQHAAIFRHSLSLLTIMTSGFLSRWLAGKRLSRCFVTHSCWIGREFQQRVICRLQNRSTIKTTMRLLLLSFFFLLRILEASMLTTNQYTGTPGVESWHWGKKKMLVLILGISQAKWRNVMTWIWEGVTSRRPPARPRLLSMRVSGGGGGGGVVRPHANFQINTYEILTARIGGIKK